MSALDDLNFDDDFAAALGLPIGRRASIEKRGSLEIWVRLRHADEPNEEFIARLKWTEYPGDLPPSVVFVDPATGQTGVARAWPGAAGFRPPNDICATWTREGYVAHPEWLHDTNVRIRIQANPIVQFLGILIDEFDRSYAGRFRG